MGFFNKNSGAVDIYRLNKRLALVNIIYVLIALVAAISLLFFPLIKLDMGKVADELQAEAENSEEQGAEGDTAAADGEELMAEIVRSVSFKLTTVDVCKFAFNADPVKPLSKIFGKLLEDAMENVIVPLAFQGALEGVIEEGESINSLNGTEIVNELKKLEEITPENKGEKIAQFCDTLAEAGGITLDDETRASLQNSMTEIYDSTVEKAGAFSLEAFICAASSEQVGDGSQVYTNYEDLAYAMLKDDAFSDMTDAISSIMAVVKAAAIFLLVCALSWVLFAIMALMHVFIKKKKVMTFYVKILGGLPCLILGVLPKVMMNAIARTAGDNAVFTALFGAYSTTVWVSGVCYLLLWAVALLFAYPINHQIKKLRKANP